MVSFHEYLKFSAFKVKTTEPKRYLVRPNQEILHPGQHLDVKISLQPQEALTIRQTLQEDPASLSDFKDKFLIQCLTMEESTLTDLQKKLAENEKETIGGLLQPFWSETPSSKLGNLRLSCVFQSPEQSQNPTETKDLAELNEKYNKLLTYTISLTSERDRLKTSYEEAATELSESRKNSKFVFGKDMFKQDNSRAGFGLVHMIVVALMAYAVGVFLDNTTVKEFGESFFKAG